MPFPTPKDLAARRPPALTVTPAAAPVSAPAPAPAPTPEPRVRQPRATPPPLEQLPGAVDFDAPVYEHLLRRAGVHGNAVTIGCVLTGYALPDGRLDRVLTIGELVTATGLDRSHVAITLRQMQRQGWIARPEHTDSRDTRPRPITLTIPARPQTQPV